MILDVGCGPDPKGDVNLDIHRQAVNNFVCGDAHRLAFRDQVFSVVVSSHMLEHTRYPYDVLVEMKRVANGMVVVRVPSEMNVNIHTKHHIYTWNPYTLRNLLQTVFDEVETGYTSRRWIREHRVARFVHQWLHVLLSKMGMSSEVYAICRVKEGRGTIK